MEIGVSAGGTSAILLDALEMHCQNYTLFSLYLNNQFYWDKKKEIGFLAQQYKHIKPLKKGFHKLITGKYAPMSVEIIDDKIDLMIIDTVHELPGEILDFIVFFHT